jgi:UDP-galactopyranose mutase
LHRWIVVGAGFTGAVIAERIASQLNERVLVVDRRDHVAGNAFDCLNEDGVLIHRYGPHIFHTNSDRVWNYLQKFSSWRPYEHKVLASVDGARIPLPFNLNSIDRCFPASDAAKYRRLLIERFGEDARVPVLSLRQEQHSDLRALGDYVYKKIFLHYTIKQWGLRPEQLSPSVTARVPILVGRDDRYFQDKYQAMPARGYAALFQSILTHSRIEVRLNSHFGQSEYAAARKENPGVRIVFTGPIDEFFGRCFGALPYRSLRFEHEVFAERFRQPVGTINFPNDHGYTRATEIKHVTGQEHGKTVITYEYPEQYSPGLNEPYYPVPRDETQELLNRYLEHARKWPDVFFCGRLGDYKYYNMDQAIGAALSLFEKKIAN